MIGVKELKKGSYILYKSEPFKVLSIQNVTYSTHTHTKIKLELEGLFSNTKEVLTLMPHAVVEDIEIKKKRGQLIAKLGDKAQVMDLVSYETFDADIEKEMLEQLNEGEEITFVEFNGKCFVIGKRQKKRLGLK